MERFASIISLFQKRLIFMELISIGDNFTDELRYQLSLCGATVVYTVGSLLSVAMEAIHGSELQV